MENPISSLQLNENPRVSFVFLTFRTKSPMTWFWRWTILEMVHLQNVQCVIVTVNEAEYCWGRKVQFLESSSVVQSRGEDRLGTNTKTRSKTQSTDVKNPSPQWNWTCTLYVLSVWLLQRTRYLMAFQPSTWGPSWRWWREPGLLPCCVQRVATRTQRSSGSKTFSQWTSAAATAASSSCAQVQCQSTTLAQRSSGHATPPYSGFFVF